MSTGIRTIEDLRDRCWVDDITGCWHLRGSKKRLWLSLLGRHVSTGAAIGFLKTGRLPRKGVYWYCTCETAGCANPEHRKLGSRSAQMLAAKIKRSPLTLAKMARGRTTIPAEYVIEIMSSDEPSKVIAERLGISRTAVYDYRHGRRRGQAAAPGSSVFNMGCTR